MRKGVKWMTLRCAFTLRSRVSVWPEATEIILPMSIRLSICPSIPVVTPPRPHCLGQPEQSGEAMTSGGFRPQRSPFLTFLVAFFFQSLLGVGAAVSKDR